MIEQTNDIDIEIFIRFSVKRRNCILYKKIGNDYGIQPTFG